MTREVWVEIRGMHFLPDGGEPQAVTSACPGLYYEKGGGHYVLFEESAGDGGETVRNTLKIREGRMELRRRGAYEAHMVFEKDKTNPAVYRMPFGSIRLDVAATDVRVEESECLISARASYALETDGGKVSDCEIRVDITSRPFPAASP